MANSPNPDYIPSIMSDEFGTVVLITNPKSDKYLKSVKTSIMREQRDTLRAKTRMQFTKIRKVKAAM